MKVLDKINGKFGFGCMRLPRAEDGKVDRTLFSEMVDAYMASGLNYFDTAKIYMGGDSEEALRDCLTSRYPRESFVLTDKLSAACFKTAEDLPALFETQLRSCGVEYFDFYLMHAQRRGNYPQFKEARAYEFASEMKQRGKIKRLGLSFHDTADFLDELLTENPFVDVVQLQFNYADYEDEKNQSRLCYEVAKKHGKPVIVMEPIRGGALIDMPERAKALLSTLGDGSPASYAIRFAASFDNIFMVLSGMSNLGMVEENVAYMKDFVPLTVEEKATLLRVGEMIRTEETIPCTACKYCVDGCPKKINIPDIFKAMNKKTRCESAYTYSYASAVKDGGRASDCIGWGKCERVCPQHIEIRAHLDECARVFDK